MSLEEVYKRGIELLDQYYSQVPDEEPKKRRSDGKSWPTYKKRKKCAYPGCKKMIVAKGMKIYCPEHTEVRRKEHLKRGWDKQNEKRRELRLSIKEKS